MNSSLETFVQNAPKCRNGCEFFGNSSWDGLCSVCYQQQQQQLLRIDDHHIDTLSAVRLPPALDVLPASLAAAAAATAATQHPQPLPLPSTNAGAPAPKKSFMSLFWGAGPAPQTHAAAAAAAALGPTHGATTPAVTNTAHTTPAVSPPPAKKNTSPASTTHSSANATASHASGTTVKNRRLAFINSLKKPEAAKITPKIQEFIATFKVSAETMSIEKQVSTVQEFFDRMRVLILKNPLWKDKDAIEQEYAIDGFESYVMEKLYDYVFRSKATDDIEKDNLLFGKTDQCQWLKMKHLGVNIDLTNQEEYVMRAVQEIRRMESKKAPREKLIAIMRCSKCVFAILQSVQRVQSPAGADEFLPMLIYVVVKANLQHLHSNLQYISRFCNPKLTTSGETAYFYTNLCGTAVFLENLSAESLNMDPSEFNSRISGEYNDTEWSVVDDMPNTESGRRLCEDFVMMQELRSQQLNLGTQMNSLQDYFKMHRNHLRKPSLSPSTRQLVAKYGSKQSLDSTSIDSGYIGSEKSAPSVMPHQAKPKAVPDFIPSIDLDRSISATPDRERQEMEAAIALSLQEDEERKRLDALRDA